MVEADESRITTGTVIGARYRIIRALDAGGMGAIYEAENTWTKRRVAVKVMRPDGERSPEFVRRFVREAQAAGKLSHENIVEVLDMGDDPDANGLFIAYELLVGQNLRERLLATRRLPAPVAIDLLAPIMEALVVVHAQGLVHRDLKPENIFLAKTSRGVVPKVIDFGIAKVIVPDPDNPDRTRTGEMMGTPHYMSPEQVMGETDIDERADVWSMGVVLYEALAGTRPYRASSVGLFVTEVLTGKPRPLGEAAPHLSPALVEVIHGALVPREGRYPTMAAFLEALRGVPLDRAATVEPTPQPTPQPTPEAPLQTAVQIESFHDISQRDTLRHTSEPEAVNHPTPVVMTTPAERPPELRQNGLKRSWLAVGVAVVVVGVVGWRLRATPAVPVVAPREVPRVDPPAAIAVQVVEAPDAGPAVDASVAAVPAAPTAPAHAARPASSRRPRAGRDGGTSRASGPGFVAE